MLSNTVSRIRRNHGLEHATIHMLSARHKNFSAQGNSNHKGFYLNIYGDVDEADVRQAVHEAHRRLKGGEHQLAVHPNCGTVLLTTASLATLAAQAVFGIEQWRQRRSAFNPRVVANALPTAVVAVVLALIISRPIGMAIQQQFTTEGQLGDLEVVSIRRIDPSPLTRVFQVLLAPGRELAVRAYYVETRG